MAQYALRYPPAEKSKESKDSTAIRIDQIRSLIDSAQTRPQIGACSVMLLSPADTMNVNAANSLLKLLEEPPARQLPDTGSRSPGATCRPPFVVVVRTWNSGFHQWKTALAWLQSRGQSESERQIVA